jgi:hypothetical protein
MPPHLVADAILIAHAGVVLFVVLGQLAVLVGGWRGWTWVRAFGFRAAHLALIVYVALQAWLGLVCPLTVWEQDFRRAAGQSAYTETFIEHWLSRLLFYEAPWWIFVAVYTAFAALVAWTWWKVPPRRPAFRRRP